MDEINVKSLILRVLLACFANNHFFDNQQVTFLRLDKFENNF